MLTNGAFYSSPTKVTENRWIRYNSASEDEEEGDTKSEDEDFILGDEDTSEDDEEANKFKMNASNQKRNPSTIARGQRINQQMQEIAEEAAYWQDDDDELPMFDSNEMRSVWTEVPKNRRAVPGGLGWLEDFSFAS